MSAKSSTEDDDRVTTALELSAESNVDTTYHERVTRNLQRTDSVYYGRETPLQHAMHKLAPLAHCLNFQSRHTSSGYAVAPRHDLILNTILRWLVPVNVPMHLFKFFVILTVLCTMLLVRGYKNYMNKDGGSSWYVTVMGITLILWWWWYYRKVFSSLRCPWMNP